MWLKITFDGRAPGRAKVGNGYSSGQWVVFDKDQGYVPGTLLPAVPLFYAPTVAACGAYIDRAEGLKP